MIGCDPAQDSAADVLTRAYGPQRILRMRPESAELAKYASNAFLAVKLSYANSLARLCSRMGGDIGEVVRAVGADFRIGPYFLKPGPGWGGSCLPKDTAALLHSGKRADLDLPEVDAARRTNDAQCAHVVDTVCRLLRGGIAGARVTAFGLTFKAHTSDVRDSPALRVCDGLTRAGAQVIGHDPRLNRIAPAKLQAAGVTGVDDPYLAAKAARAVVVLTEWPQFRELDWCRIADQAPDGIVLDTRNILDASDIRRSGLIYLGNGMPGGY